MTRSELVELIANGENSGVEFKRDDLRPEQIAKEIVALANFQGGRLLLGVEDDGTITGVRRDDLEHWVMDTVFGRYVHPMIQPFYEEIRIDERRRVAVVTVTEGTAKPYVVRHRGQEQVYVRMGSTSQLASREQQMRLFSAGGMLYVESLPVSGSGLRDLSRERLADYLTTVLGLTDMPTADAEWSERLCDLGFMVENPGRPAVCTIAGLMLFGYRPRRLLRHAGVRWMAFKGEDKAYDALDDQVIDGPLVAHWRELSGGGRELVEKGLIERLADAMRPFISEEAGEVDESMRRQRRWHYPLEAVREAVVNAVTHRDWTRYEEIEVARYVDRVEILSPGALQNSMTVQKMIAGRRSPRNLLISEVMRDYGYADARGMGVRNKIVPLLRERNGVEPEFDANEDHLRLTMRRGPAPAVCCSSQP
jgi:ATP-dependent DNA helicase RecG